MDKPFSCNSSESRLVTDSVVSNQLMLPINDANQIGWNQDKNCENCMINFPEKIVFVIDTVCESKTTLFKSRTGVSYSSLYMIKRVVEIFFHNKWMLNQNHEFALLIMDGQKVYWHCDFTGDYKSLLSSLESIEESDVNYDLKYFDIQQVFQLVHQQVIFEKQVLQSNVVRIILLYCRSITIPRFNIMEAAIQDLISNPNFFLDILYIHETPSTENKCEEIYTELTKLDIKNDSYIMEVSTNAVKIHNCMARLLAHPIQRVPQKDIKYSIHPSIMKIIKEDN